jgi:hypothetical protein
MLVAVLIFVFWIWMLVDCLTNESLQGTDKLIWVLVILLAHAVGALIYYFVVKIYGHPPPRQQKDA